MKNIICSFILSIFMAGNVFAQDNVLTYNVNQCKVILLSEGQQQGKTDILIGATPEMLNECAPEGVFPNACNAFLVQAGGKNILIDTGYGRNLFDNLALFDVTPEQIDAILITHMHGDHIGGMLREGVVAFPNAQIYLAQPEYDYWMEEGANKAQAQQVIAAYKEQLQLFTPVDIDISGSSELLPGIRPIAAYGHTPGHTVYLISNNKAQLLIWGDLTHAMAIQMPYPQVAVRYDVDTQQAVVVREKIMLYAAQNRIPVAGMHIAYPAIGMLNPNPEGGYLFIPVEK